VQRLKEVSRRHGERHWDTIASELGVRKTCLSLTCLSLTYVSLTCLSLTRQSRLSVSYLSCSHLYVSNLSVSDLSVSDPSVSPVCLSDREDGIPVSLVSKQSVSEPSVSDLSVPHLSVSQTGRTAFLCLQTFQRFVSDSLKRGVWVPEEDALLRELVDKMRIGNFIPYTQCNCITL